MVKRSHCESLLTTDGAIHAKKLLSFSVAKTTHVYDSAHRLRLISPAREQHACSSGLANVMSDSRPAFFVNRDETKTN